MLPQKKKIGHRMHYTEPLTEKKNKTKQKASFLKRVILFHRVIQLNVIVFPAQLVFLSCVRVLAFVLVFLSHCEAIFHKDDDENDGSDEECSTGGSSRTNQRVVLTFFSVCGNIEKKSLITWIETN